MTAAQKTQPAAPWTMAPVAELTAYVGNVLPEADPELTASIAADGITDPLYVQTTSTGDLQIIDGRRRLAAAVAAGLTEVPTSSRPMIRVTELHKHPRNARTDATAPREMVESVRTEGVLIPVKVVSTPQGWMLVDGHMRLDAATRAEVTHVPYEVDQRDEASQMLDMVTTARHRNGLTVGEERNALFTAAELGADIKRVARAGGMTQKDAKRLITSGTSEAVKKVTAAAPAYSFTLEDLEQLAWLGERDAEAVAEIEQAATKGSHQTRWLIERAVLRAERAEKAAARRAELEATGARVLRPVDLSPKARPLRKVDGAPAEHAETCQGHVWVITDRGDDYEPWCTNVTLYGHATEAETAETSGKPSTEQIRAVKAGNLDWDAATTVRRQALAKVIGRRTQPKAVQDAMNLVTASALMSADFPSTNGTVEILAELLGVDEKAVSRHPDRVALVAKAPTNRRTVIAFAITAAGFEARMRRNAWRTDGQRCGETRRAAAQWLRWEAEVTGRAHTPIEAAVAADQPYDPAAAAEGDQQEI